MIEPPPCSAMWRAARWLPTMTPKTFTRINASKSRRSSSRKRRRRARDPGVVAHDVQAAELLDREVDGAWTCVGVGDVGLLERDRVAELRRQALRRRSASTSAMTTSAPSSTKRSTIAAADAAGTAGDDRDLPGELAPCVPPDVSRLRSSSRGRCRRRAARRSRRSRRGPSSRDRPADRADVVLHLGDGAAARPARC